MLEKSLKNTLSYFKKTNFITFLYIDLLGVWEFHLLQNLIPVLFSMKKD